MKNEKFQTINELLFCSHKDNLWGRILSLSWFAIFLVIPQLFPLQLNKCQPITRKPAGLNNRSQYKKKKTRPQNVACFLRPLVLFSVLMTCVVGTAATDTLNILELKGPGKLFSEIVIKLWENSTEHFISMKSKVEAQWAKPIQADLLGLEKRLW